MAVMLICLFSSRGLWLWTDNFIRFNSWLSWPKHVHGCSNVHKCFLAYTQTCKKFFFFFMCPSSVCTYDEFQFSLLNHFWSQHSHSKALPSVLYIFSCFHVVLPCTVIKDYLWHHLHQRHSTFCSPIHIWRTWFPGRYISWYKRQHSALRSHRLIGCTVACPVNVR